MEHINETLNKMGLSKKLLGLPEVLESYKHIELTEDETMEAIILAKQKKEQILKQQEIKERQDENRKKFTQTKWNFEQTKSFALWRAEQIFNGNFNLDAYNSIVFELMCSYFSSDESFVGIGSSLGFDGFSLDKGILLCGSYGTGKTWMMKLFQKNQRHCFYIKNAKEISDLYESSGEKEIEDFLVSRKNAVNDSAVFYQPFLGLCIDDLGTESLKVNYGNKKNVIGDIVERRYASGNTGVSFHCTTNLTAKAIDDFYGTRISSRMKEIFNIIELNGSDRRK